MTPEPDPKIRYTDFKPKWMRDPASAKEMAEAEGNGSWQIGRNEPEEEDEMTTTEPTTFPDTLRAAIRDPYGHQFEGLLLRAAKRIEELEHREASLVADIEMIGGALLHVVQGRMGKVAPRAAEIEAMVVRAFEESDRTE